MAKPKNKTHKKIDNNIRLALTETCEQFLENINGFDWLTHQANYNNFPASLLITCVFDTDTSLREANQNGDSIKMQGLIQDKLLTIGIKLKTPNKQVIFDSEESLNQ